VKSKNVFEPYFSPPICVTKNHDFGSWELNGLQTASVQLPLTQHLSLGITDYCFQRALVKKMVQKKAL